MVNSNSGKCLAISGGVPTDAAPAIQFDCHTDPDGSRALEQLWTWTKVSDEDSTYTIENKKTEKCLAIGGASHTLGAKAIQWTCESGHKEQQWVYDSTGRLWNNESNLCLAIPEASTANSIAAIQWTCEGVFDDPPHTEQQWSQNWA